MYPLFVAFIAAAAAAAAATAAVTTASAVTAAAHYQWYFNRFLSHRILVMDTYFLPHLPIISYRDIIDFMVCFSPGMTH